MIYWDFKSRQIFNNQSHISWYINLIIKIYYSNLVFKETFWWVSKLHYRCNAKILKTSKSLVRKDPLNILQHFTIHIKNIKAFKVSKIFQLLKCHTKNIKDLKCHIENINNITATYKNLVLDVFIRFSSWLFLIEQMWNISILIKFLKCHICHILKCLYIQWFAQPHYKRKHIL